MPLYQAVILAVVQGVTEFLPISSSAHLALAPWLLGWKDQTLVFDIALHLGTLAAVLAYFFRDWLQIAAQGIGIPYSPDPELRRNPRLLWLLVAASVPVGVFGVLVHHEAEEVWRHNRLLIGGMLIGVGLLMAVADRLSRRRKDLGQVSAADALWVGLAQALALVPGTSRSGITITAGLFRHFDRAAAARFSFLLSTPAIAAAAAKAALDLVKAGGVPPDMRLAFAVGVAVSALTGCLVITLFLRFLRSHDLKFFVCYRVVFGIIVIALVFFRHPAA
jgi:undecaprenyl-diphosphatase